MSSTTYAWEGAPAIKDFPGLRVLWPKPGEQLARIEHDIVFVHGLHSGPVSDWQDEGGPFWPAEFLGQDLEHTRILSFGYDTNKSNVRPDDTCEEVRIFNHGEALCSDLWDNRVLLKNCMQKSDPSITFIGHGTGGIVIKSALCYSHARRSQLDLVLRRTKHVIFLDTPHAGLNEDAWRSISRGTFSENSDSQWKLWSNVLSDLRKSFSEIASSFNVTSACASLRSSQRSVDGEVTPGDSGLTYLGHERVLHLYDVKHLTISKFSSREDPNYLRLANRVRAGWTCITSDEDHISKVWSWLRSPTAGGGQPSPFGSMRWNKIDHETALQRWHPNTGGWLLRNETWQSWASRSPFRREDTRVLWLTGQKGAGKSVLCSYSIDTISKPLGSGNKTSDAPLSPATPYIYLRYENERDKCQLAQFLAEQLLDHVLREQGSVDKEVLSLLKQNASDARNLCKLIRLLVAQCSTVYFFLDGLNKIALADATTSENRRRELDCLKEDLRSTVKFLADMTRDDTVHVRLWCSSQKSQTVIPWMQDIGAKELSILEVPWEDKSKGACHNLEPDIMIPKEDMMHRCTPLVKFVPFNDTATSDGFLSLSHGSDFEFLHEKVPDEKPGDQEQIGREHPSTPSPSSSAAPPAAAAQQLLVNNEPTLFRRGEMVWYQQAPAWRIGVIRQVGAAPTHAYTIAPLGHALLRMPDLVKQQQQMRPFLTFSVPGVGFEDIPNTIFSEVPWQELINKHAHRAELVGLEASKMAALEIDSSWSVFNRLAPQPQDPPAQQQQQQPPKNQTRYDGAFLGAEMVRRGDPIRHKDKSKGTLLEVAEIIVTSTTVVPAPGAGSSSSSTTPQPPTRQDFLSFRGVEYEAALVPEPTYVTKQPHGAIFAKDTAFRSAAAKAGGANQKCVWTIKSWDATWHEVEVGGRSYVTDELIHVTTGAEAVQQALQTGKFTEAPAFLNNRMQNQNAQAALRSSIARPNRRATDLRSIIARPNRRATVLRSSIARPNRRATVGQAISQAQPLKPGEGIVEDQ